MTGSICIDDLPLELAARELLPARVAWRSAILRGLVHVADAARATIARAQMASAAAPTNLALFLPKIRSLTGNTDKLAGPAAGPGSGSEP